MIAHVVLCSATDCDEGLQLRWIAVGDVQRGARR